MTTPYYDPTGTATAPPPDCPAHAGGHDGLRRLYGPEAEAQPYALYEQLRKEHGAVAPVLLHGDVPAWLVLGHRENLEVMSSPQRFTADSRNWRALAEGRVAQDSPLLPIITWQPLVAFADGDAHARLRSAVTDSLERISAHGTRRYITRYADRLIDDFGSQGHADLLSDFAQKLPALVLCQRFGIAEQDALRLGAAVRDMISGSATAIESNQVVEKVMRDLVERKTRQPGEDFASWLIGHRSGLTAQEVAEHLRHSLVASMSTVINLIAGTLRKVLTDRGFRGSLSGGTMTLPDSLDQVLWDDPPLAVVPTRWAVRDTTLAGQQIRAGDMVMVGIAAGNVDPEIRPDLTVSVHGNRSHLAFGAGPHQCPGQDIGRAIAETGIDRLLARVPDLELSVAEDELTVVGSWMARGLTSLPVRFTALRVEQQAGTPAPAVGAALPDAVPQRETAAEPGPARKPRRRWFGWLRR
ncbi:cytochrome P450 [Streptomyces sp. NPDC007861]|uniref:cytochrome P450 n=1 Tax=Streptomyces sp. NPDC007861 TaxID=3154893 RepID=UPI003403437E